MKLFIILVIGIFYNFSLLGQSTCLKSKIISDSQSPIPYASIKVKNKSIGTVSNEEGYFVLRVDDVAKIDTIIVSSIGHETKLITIEELLAFNDKNFELKAFSQILNEVVVHNKDALEIIKEAISKTEQNLVKKENIYAYYKESTSNNNELIKYADASLFGYIDCTQKNFNLQLKIIESRIKNNELQESKILALLEPSINIKIPFEKFFSLYKLKNMIEEKDKYVFSLNDEENGYHLLVINPKDDIEEPLSQAKIFINNHTQKIEMIDYMILPKQAVYFKKIIILGISSYVTGIKIKVIYENQSDKTYLKYYNIQVNQFVSNSKEKLNFASNSELLISEIKTKNLEEIPRNEQYTKKNVFKNGNNFNNEFWLKYNTILPTAKQNSELVKN